MKMNKIIHRKVTIYYVIIPIIITTIVWLYSYFENNIYDENILTMLIDQVFLPFYITIFWVVFSLYLEDEEMLHVKNYKFQLRLIAFSIIILIGLKLLFRDMF